MSVSSFKQFMERDQSITDFTHHGNCSECGNCCTNMLPLKSSEIQRIRAYIKKHHIRPHVVRLPLAAPVFDATCPFLKTDTDKKRCMIYDVRPFICRHFICSRSEEQLAKDLASGKTAREPMPVHNVRQLFFS